MEPFATRIAAAVAQAIGCEPSVAAAHVQPSNNPERGDLSLPCFPLAAAAGKPGKAGAMAIAQQIAALDVPDVSFEASGPFVNIRLDPQAVAREVLTAVWTQTPYGGSDEGAGKTIVIDFSSPNIAKPFHLGHLRSTVIGWSLGQLYRTLGYTVVGVNHLGDWGTQFGFMIAAWKRWKDEAEQRVAAGEIEIEVFADLYVRINAAGKEDPAIREEAQAWFKKLEDGDPEARELWTYFVERSKKEFLRVYEILGIKHESEAGEAFYNDKMPAMVERLKASGLLVDGETKTETAERKIAAAKAKVAAARKKLAESDAKLATLEGKKKEKEQRKRDKLAASLPGLEKAVEQIFVPTDDDGSRPQGVDLGKGQFAILLKSDGGTTYTTRDLTAAFYRKATYDPHKILYVVGNTQRDHFLPWFEIVKKMEPEAEWAKGLQHVGFGNYLGMSTRKGTAVFLNEVLEKGRLKAKEMAEKATKKVELTDEETEAVARAIGTGGLKFFDLKAERTKDIDLSVCAVCLQNAPIPYCGICQPCKDRGVEDPGTHALDWERLLNLRGDSGPYLQFAYARLAGILRRYEGEVSLEAADCALLTEPESQALLKAIGDFPARVRQAAEACEPSVIARYVVDLSQKTHAFVHHHRVIDAEAEGVDTQALRATRVLLVTCAKKVIAEALDLLGIEALEKM